MQVIVKVIENQHLKVQSLSLNKSKIETWLKKSLIRSNLVINPASINQYNHKNKRYYI